METHEDVRCLRKKLLLNLLIDGKSPLFVLRSSPYFLLRLGRAELVANSGCSLVRLRGPSLQLVAQYPGRAFAPPWKARNPYRAGPRLGVMVEQQSHGRLSRLGPDPLSTNQWAHRAFLTDPQDQVLNRYPEAPRRPR